MHCHGTRELPEKLFFHCIFLPQLSQSPNVRYFLKIGIVTDVIAVVVSKSSHVCPSTSGVGRWHQILVWWKENFEFLLCFQALRFTALDDVRIFFAARVEQDSCASTCGNVLATSLSRSPPSMPFCPGIHLISRAQPSSLSWLAASLSLLI